MRKEEDEVLDEKRKKVKNLKKKVRERAMYEEIRGSGGNNED